MRRSELARLAWRERSFWREAWVWGVSRDGSETTIASAGHRRRKYLASLPEPMSLAVRSETVRSMLGRRFAKKLDELRADAAFLRDAPTFALSHGVNGRTLGRPSGAEQGRSKGGKGSSTMRDILVTVIWGPGLRPRITIEVAVMRGWRHSRPVRFQRLTAAELATLAAYASLNV